MDVEKLIGEVAARNGIRIEPDDPAFALVTLNQLVLEDAVKILVREIHAATADFESAAERVQNGSDDCVGGVDDAFRTRAAIHIYKAVKTGNPLSATFGTKWRALHVR
ncbi:MAG: hypothetical protein IRY89_14470 [Pseudolabrys sp.]|nr:hypothetical protein [Pseudolabrys sp.]